MKNKINIKLIIIIFFTVILSISFLKRSEIGCFTNFLIAETYIEKKDYKKATIFYNNCLELSQKTHNKKYLIRSLEFLTTAIRDSNFDPNLEKLFYTFLKDFDRRHDADDVISLYNDIGSSCLKHNNPAISEYFFKAALGKLMENDDYNLSDFSLIAYNLGTLYESQKQYKTLLKTDLLALKNIEIRINEKEKFKKNYNESLYDRYRMLFLARLGYTYKVTKNYTAAEKYYLKDLNIAKSQKKTNLILLHAISNKLSELYAEKGDIAKAKYYKELY